MLSAACFHMTTAPLGQNMTLDKVHDLQGLDAGATGAYMCGPGSFMAAVGTALQELGFPGNHVYSESFSF